MIIYKIIYYYEKEINNLIKEIVNFNIYIQEICNEILNQNDIIKPIQSINNHVNKICNTKQSPSNDPKFHK